MRVTNPTWLPDHPVSVVRRMACSDRKAHGFVMLPSANFLPGASKFQINPYPWENSKSMEPQGAILEIYSKFQLTLVLQWRIKITLGTHWGSTGYIWDFRWAEVRWFRQLLQGPVIANLRALLTSNHNYGACRRRKLVREQLALFGGWKTQEVFAFDVSRKRNLKSIVPFARIFYELVHFWVAVLFVPL